EHPASGCVPDHLLALLAEALDAEMHLVARLEEDGGLVAEADARGRAGGDHVAGHERDEAADIAHQGLDAEDHGPGVAGLAALAIDVEEHVEVAYVLDLVAGHHPGTGRPEGVVALALGPLAAALD